MSMWVWILSLLGASSVATILGVWYVRRRLLRAEMVSAEQKNRLEKVTIATERVVESARRAISAETGPDELPVIEESLLQALAAGECALFAGSGISAQAGLPVWQQILAAAIDEFEGVEKNLSWDPVRQMLAEGRPEVAADLISTRVSREDLLRFFTTLYEGETQIALPSILRVLGDMPFARILTTNWDSLVEQAFRHRSGHVLSPDRSEQFAAVYRENAFMILKLYGELSRPESVSCSAEEFRRSIEDNPDFFKFISSIYSTNTILFLGLSLTGIEDFVSALRLRGDTNRAHFALVPWQPDFSAHEERFRSRYGIRLMAFRKSAGFPEVLSWTQQLHDACLSMPPIPQAASIRQLTLTRLQLENIGSFRRFDQLLNPGWNLLLGNNGLGKSTILKSIAMALCGGDPKAARAASSLLRAGERIGWIRIWLGDDRYELRLKRTGTDVSVECDRYTPLQTGTLVALGFPPLRGVSLRNPLGPKQIDSPNPVIEDILPLLLGSIDSRVDNLKQWLVNLQTRIESSSTPPQDRSRAVQMRDTFFRIMDELSPGLEVSFDHVDTRTWQVMVLTNDGTVSIDQLSQGMTSLLGWVGALLERMYEIHRLSSTPEQEPALLLVDEIAAHMHPEWEYAMVPLIRSNFPRLQVIASTHSPLIVANTQKGEVFHLHRKRNEIEVEKLTISFEGLRTDQVLTGPAFRLPTTLDPETKKLRDEYTVLLGKNRIQSEERRFQEIARKLALRIPKPHEREEGREAIALLEQWMTERIKSKPLEHRLKVINEANQYFAQLDTEGSSSAEGSFSDALTNYEEALKSFRVLKDGRGEASTLKSLGDFQRENGDPSQALKTYEEALTIFGGIADATGQGNVLLAIGDVGHSRGEYEKALQLYNRALKLFRAALDEMGEAWSLGKIGEVLRSQGRITEAYEHFKSAVDLFEVYGNKSGIGVFSKAIGDILGKRGEVEGALNKYKQVLELATSVADRRLEAATLQAMGDLDIRLGDLDSARSRYDAALSAAQDAGDRRRLAWIRKALGDLQRRRVGPQKGALGG
jgi:tetratricopeptide (TPR) repeat protein